MNAKKRFDQLILGSKNLDRMKSDIDSYVRIIAYFITFTGCLDFHLGDEKGHFVFTINKSRWTLDILVEKHGVVKAVIICEQLGRGEDRWYEIYRYDAIKHVINLHMKMWQVKQVYNELPLLEEKIGERFGGWYHAMKTFVESSEVKF